MSQNTERGARSERGSALWGTGSRGGDRSSVLWAGGRGILVTCVAAFALAAPMAAMADSGKDKGKDNGAIASSFIAPSLLNATGKVDVIIQSSKGTSDAVSKTKGLGVFQKDMKQLSLIGAVEAVVPASQLKKLAGVSGLIGTPNADVKLSGVGTTQLWPYESGNALMWPGDTTTYAGKTPAIAIVDSGIEDRADFQGRVIGTSTSRRSRVIPGDGRGHGTFVAGIAAGAATVCRDRSLSAARVDRRSRRPRHGPDERRHQCRAVDPDNETSTTSALRTSRCTRLQHDFYRRPARSRRRTAVVRRRRGGHGRRQLRDRRLPSGVLYSPATTRS